MITTGGRQFRDWTADYRLFSKERFDFSSLFDVARRETLKRLTAATPFVVAMDDSLLRKTGQKVNGVKCLRDPLSPPFHTNLVYGQRVLQLSAAMMSGPAWTRARMIPIDFKHTPAPRKPRADASGDKLKEYKIASKEMNLAKKGADRLKILRENIDQDAGEDRPLWTVVDGRFTNATVLKKLPDRTVLIGRIRKDTKLYHPPEPSQSAAAGRKALYGERAPTPEALEHNESLPWQTQQIFMAGEFREINYKTLSPLRWRKAGGKKELRLIVVGPLPYKARQAGGRLRKRRPAYLICTDPNISIEKALQAYAWRWDIEVNFRDEKTLLGTGQAQVRKETSVEGVPQLLVGAYSLLLVAACQTFGAEGIPQSLPSPKWRRKEKGKRPSTLKLINHLRAELWGKAMGIDNFSSFTSKAHADQNPNFCQTHPGSAVLYATK